MTGLLTVVAAVLVFGTVVLVHELGHFLAARRCGIRVEEFSIGFGPALWSRVRNGTRYSIRLLPLGGYNALAGEEPAEEEQEKAEEPPAYNPHTPLLPATMDGRTYAEAGPWQRFFVIAAGALMNFLLGFVVILILTASQDAVTSKVIYDFVGDNPRSEQTGLQAGDEILAVNGHICFTAEDVIYELQRTEDYSASFTVLRDGHRVTLPDVQFDSRTESDGSTSMVLDFRVYGIEKTPRTVVSGAIRYFCYYSRVILRGFVDLFTGRVGINELSGPVGVVSAVSEAVQYGWRDVLSLAAVITVNLGIFNLLPIPGLDGFKLLFLAAEGITRREVPVRVQAALNAAGMVLLLMLMVMVTMQDVAKYFL
ncbi:MAG: M50 family metallopeptidase [Gemmiger sp.]|uniref:M50 family metallopeptidase n=1 Tax=Gemmiger sp. TaxID=2049027 RepID=UPI002E780B5C|nr:M50 family metallopeptidase [Gemmiger sp.]MEE0801596.1 M50 family metallopeptidase [Gemmiger sp.]